MARSRNIKPGFFQNEDLAECDPLARVLFAGLWCEADRAGRLEDRPKRIKAAVLPYDNCDIDELLGQLHAGGFIVRYEVDGKRYIQIVEFAKHQTPHMKEAASTIPAQCKSGASPVQVRDENNSSPSDSGFRIPDSSSSTQGESSRSGEDHPPHEREEVPPVESPSVAGLACRAMREAGIPLTNPSHIDLRALVDAGVTVAEFRDTAIEAVSRGKPDMAYVLGMIRGRRKAAAELAQQHGAANTSRAPPAPSTSKTVAGIQALEELLDEYREENPGVVRGDDHSRAAAAAVLVPRRSAAAGSDEGDGRRVDRRHVARADVDDR